MHSVPETVDLSPFFLEWCSKKKGPDTKTPPIPDFYSLINQKVLETLIL